MPFGIEGVEPGISGGGFRATLFHCGALCRLGELGILARLDRVSSVSGGSITAGVLATRWTALRFEGDVAVNLRGAGRRAPPGVLPPDDRRALGLGALLPGRRPSDLLQAAYAEHLYGAVTLRVLPGPGVAESQAMSAVEQATLGVSTSSRTPQVARCSCSCRGFPWR